MFKRDEHQSLNICKLLNPIDGFTVRSMIECATECLELSALCEGFIFSGITGLCKLAGSSGTFSADCFGEFYRVF